MQDNILQVRPATGIQARIRVPGSKSLTNRALLLAALAQGTSCLSGVLFSEDTQYMLDALATLGFETTVDETLQEVSITGCAGRIPKPGALFLGNAGTCVRFLTAAAVLADEGACIDIDGSARMQQRPIQDLVDALCSVGCRIDYLNEAGCPPLRIAGGGFAGGRVSMAGNKSSQYFSALLMIGPYGRKDLELVPKGTLVSQPYVRMTRGLMQDFGVEVREQDGIFTVPAGQCYKAKEYPIEPDASAGSYFLGAAAILGGCVTLDGLGSDSVQGDAAFAKVLERMGCKLKMDTRTITLEGGDLCGIDVDLNMMPDVALTLAVVALFANGTTRIRNVANLKIKECDRLAALHRELGRLNAKVRLFPDGLEITPPAHDTLAGAVLDTYDDHRMAMSLYLAGLVVPGVQLKNPGCVQKTYPDYFNDMDQYLERSEHE